MASRQALDPAQQRAPGGRPRSALDNRRLGLQGQRVGVHSHRRRVAAPKRLWKY